MSRQGQTSNIQILENLSKKINEIKGNISYKNLINNTNKLLTKNESSESIKENFNKYIKILKHLYKYYIHYENLLEKYKEDITFCKFLKGLYNKKIKINDNELNAKKIHAKIFEILIKQKLKVRKLLNNILDKIIEKFNSVSDDEYIKIIKKYSKNNKISKLLSMLASIKKKNQSEKILFNKLIEYLNQPNSTQLKISHSSEVINFSEAKTKQNYLNIIRSSISEQQQNKINKINNNIKKSLNALNKIKKNINNSYKKANNPNNPNNTNNN